MQHVGGRRFGDADAAHDFLRTWRERQPAVGQATQEVDLLFGRDAQRAAQPERIDAAADVAIAVAGPVDPLLHALLAGTARDFLVEPDGRIAHAAGQAVVAVPLGDGRVLQSACLAVPADHFELVPDRAAVQRHQCVEQLEGGCRKKGLAGARGVGHVPDIGLLVVDQQGALHSGLGKARLPGRMFAPGRGMARRTEREEGEKQAGRQTVNHRNLLARRRSRRCRVSLAAHSVGGRTRIWPSAGSVAATMSRCAGWRASHGAAQ